MTLTIKITDAFVMRELKHYGQIIARHGDQGTVIMEVPHDIDLDILRNIEGVIDVYE